MPNFTSADLLPMSDLHLLVRSYMPAPALSFLYLNLHRPSSTPRMSHVDVSVMAPNHKLNCLHLHACCIADSTTLGLTMQELRVVGRFVQVVSKRSSQQ